MRLQEGTSWVVTWSGKRTDSMLVFVGRADGAAWLQPFSQRLCREITESALLRLVSDAANAPAYAACILGNQATKSGPETALFGAVFAVSQDQLIASNGWRGSERSEAIRSTPTASPASRSRPPNAGWR